MVNNYKSNMVEEAISLKSKKNMFLTQPIMEWKMNSLSTTSEETRLLRCLLVEILLWEKLMFVDLILEIEFKTTITLIKYESYLLRWGYSLPTFFFWFITTDLIRFNRIEVFPTKFCAKSADIFIDVLHYIIWRYF